MKMHRRLTTLVLAAALAMTAAAAQAPRETMVVSTAWLAQHGKDASLVLLHVGVNGHRHHVSITPGRVQSPLVEALGHYLNFEVSLPQG